ncbi:hypothetical protein, partial [Nonomuraea dietziae]|uniref:hypothetical protein n=1 Tax=Nonomuraea dietziae TaxID=65515 RepID=UPI0031DD9929
ANAHQPLRQKAWAVSAGLKKRACPARWPTGPCRRKSDADGGLSPSRGRPRCPTLGRLRQPVMSLGARTTC